MRRWLLFLNVLLLVAAAAGVYWLYASWGNQVTEEEGAPAVEGRGELGGVELPEMPQEIDRPEEEYEIVYEKTLFKKDRRYIAPESAAQQLPQSPLEDMLPNMRLGGIVMGHPAGEAKVYFEVEEMVEREIGGRKKVQTKSREMKTFSEGDKVASGWTLVRVSRTEVELEKEGEMKVVALGKPSEFDRIAMPQLPRPPASPIRQAPRPPQGPGRPSARAPSPQQAGPQAKQKQGPIVVTSGETHPVAAKAGRPVKAEQVAVKLQGSAAQSAAEKQEALEKLKKLREYVKKRQEEEGTGRQRR